MKMKIELKRNSKTVDFLAKKFIGGEVKHEI